MILRIDAFQKLAELLVGLSLWVAVGYWGRGWSVLENQQR